MYSVVEGNEWQYNDTTGFKTDTEKLTISLYPGKCEVDEEEVPDDISDILGSSQCDQPPVSSGQEIQAKTPLIDIFLNPSAESQEKKALLISKTLKVSKDYFNTVNMTKLYPELFKERFQLKELLKNIFYTSREKHFRNFLSLQLLWYSSLPCFENSKSSETSKSLIKSCQIHGESYDCKKMFRKVLTDSGICCGLNSDTADLIKDKNFRTLINDRHDDDYGIATEKV